MAGSKKGERRGGKRAGSGPMSAQKAPRAPTPAGPVVNSMAGKKTSPNRKATEEYYRSVVAVVSGEDARHREPRELMLKTMRYFEDLGDQHVQMCNWLLAQLKTLTPEKQAEMDTQLEYVERKIREFYLLATDVAYKCAPYVHARLSAVQVTGANQGPIEVVGMLLKEIDEANRGRPTWAPPDLKLVASND